MIYTQTHTRKIIDPKEYTLKEKSYNDYERKKSIIYNSIENKSAKEKRRTIFIGANMQKRERKRRKGGKR